MADCASDDEMELQTSIILRANVIFMSTLAILTFYLSYKAFMILKVGSIFHSSTRILLFTGLGFVNFHELAFFYLQIITIYRSFTLSERPCEIMRTTKECRAQNHSLIFGLAGITFTQSALSLERLIATIIPEKYSKLKKWPGIVLSIIAILCSLSAPFIIVWNDPFEDTVPNCFFFPAQSRFRANVFLMTLTGFVFFSIFLNLIIISVNKSSELSTRFLVEQRYQKREALISTRIVCYIAIAQFFALAFYSCSVLALRLMKDQIPRAYYHNIVWWAYTVPFAAVALPALLIYRINQSGRWRKKVINKITNMTETQEEHMESLKQLWG
ncbi:unnamed protein product [Caenorhabditis angaria]|uniref:Uncharacterized protein n=1 Tax=Caenorhabditis angaria TaxID=860376 RepID=A0A9P1ICZ6_9PELO|nr:unnamed protein product [Caenorhabditis angaria]